MEKRLDHSFFILKHYILFVSNFLLFVFLGYLASYIVKGSEIVVFIVVTILPFLAYFVVTFSFRHLYLLQAWKTYSKYKDLFEGFYLSDFFVNAESIDSVRVFYQRYISYFSVEKLRQDLWYEDLKSNNVILALFFLSVDRFNELEFNIFDMETAMGEAAGFSFFISFYRLSYLKYLLSYTDSPDFIDRLNIALESDEADDFLVWSERRKSLSRDYVSEGI